MASDANWMERAFANSKPGNPGHGKLHRKLGVPQGEKIPAAKLYRATNSKSPALRKEAHLAENAKSSRKPYGS